MQFSQRSRHTRKDEGLVVWAGRLVGLPTLPKEGLAEGRLCVEPGCLSPSTREGSREMLLPLLNTKQPCFLYLCQSETRNSHKLVPQQICTAFTVLSLTQRSYCYKQWVAMEFSISDRDNEVVMALNLHRASVHLIWMAFCVTGHRIPQPRHRLFSHCCEVLSLGKLHCSRGGNLEKQRKPEAAAWTIQNGADLTEKNNTI